MVVMALHHEYYHVKSGDSFGFISGHFHALLSALLSVNLRLSHAFRIHPVFPHNASPQGRPICLERGMAIALLCC